MSAPKLTRQEYQQFSDNRMVQARNLIADALEGQLPDGYRLVFDGRQMYGNAIAAIKPVREEFGKRAIYFSHAIDYRNEGDADTLKFVPSREIVKAHCDVKNEMFWDDDRRFGDESNIEIRMAAGDDLAAVVRDLIAQICTEAPLIDLEWRRDRQDASSKWELYAGDRKLQTVWRTAGRYSPLLGARPTTLDDAKREAEDAARFMLRSEHQERLAHLGDAPHADGQADDDTYQHRQAA